MTNAIAIHKHNIAADPQTVTTVGYDSVIELAETVIALTGYTTEAGRWGESRDNGKMFVEVWDDEARYDETNLISVTGVDSRELGAVLKSLAARNESRLAPFTGESK